MKNNLYLKMMLFLPALILTVTSSMAQEIKTGKVILKIEEDGKTTVDTVFELREGQDPEQLTKVISQLAGEEVFIFTHKPGGHNVMVIDKDIDDPVWHMKHLCEDSVKTRHTEMKVIVLVEGEGDSLTHKCKTLDLSIDIDSLRTAHGGAKLMVMKDEDGNFTTKVFDEEIEWVSENKECDHAEKTYKIIITDKEQPGEDEEVYILKTDDGKKVKVITEKSVVVSSAGKDEEGPVKVIVISDDDEKAEKNVKVTVKVLDEDEEDTEKVNDKQVKEGGKKKK